MPDAGIVATVCLLLALFLLALEFFIPSFGMILACALILLVVAFWSAHKAWYVHNPTFFWVFVAVAVGGIPGSVFGALHLVQHTRAGKHLILQPVPVQLKDNPLAEFIGKHGSTLTLLTPGGMVEIARERYHAESIGMLLEPGTKVVVTAVRGNRLVVRPYDSSIDEHDTAGAGTRSEGGTRAEVPSDSRKSDVREMLPLADPTTGTGEAAANNIPGGESGGDLDFPIPDD
ncbi:MAG: NfeD family protein [Planctomycetaceae bacterium]|nr:NfeD family protein [Planctomycetaceae bacterium]